MTLESLAAKYGTDKLDHGYIPFYAKHLPEAPKRILEIGVKDGASMQMWSNYFPNAEVHGLDLFAENKIEDIRSFLLGYDGDCNNNIALHQGNQCDYLLLERLREFDFDVIIDDGSHNSRDQMMAFFGLFNGKHYFIEDLHCCNDDPYTQGLPRDLRADLLFSAVNGANVYYPNAPKINFGINDKIVCIHATKPA